MHLSSYPSIVSILYIFTFFFFLTRIIDLSIKAPIYDHGPDSTCLLGATVCGYFDYDTWTLALTIWVVFQLTWSMFLLGVQLYQVAIGMTTNESANANRYAYMNATNHPMVVGGSTEGTDGPSVMEGHGGHGGHGGFCPCLQLVAGARAVHKARHRQKNTKGNVFDHGCWNNCLDFWTESADGKSAVNYYELYDVQQLNHRVFTLQPTMEV